MQNTLRECRGRFAIGNADLIYNSKVAQKWSYFFCFASEN